MWFFEIVASLLNQIWVWLQSPEMPSQVLGFLAWSSLIVSLIAFYTLVECVLYGRAKYYHLESGKFIVGTLLGFPVKFLYRYTYWFPSFIDWVTASLDKHRLKAEFREFFNRNPEHIPEIIAQVRAELEYRANELHGYYLKNQTLQQRVTKTKAQEEKRQSEMADLQNDLVYYRPRFWDAHKVALNFGFAKPGDHYTDFVDHSKFRTRQFAQSA